jgi:uncharacterized Zn finger protein
MMADLTCPNCGDGGVKLLPKVGDRDDYECRHCGPFSVSGTDRQDIEDGCRAELVHSAGRTWLKPVA